MAENITDILFSGAQSLRLPTLKKILHLGVFTQTRLWFVFDSSIPENIHRLLANWEAHEVTPIQLTNTFVKSYQAHREEDGFVNTPIPFPDVPDDDFLTFYAQARRDLDESGFAILDAAYRQAFTAAYAWFSGGVRSEDELAGYMHALTASAISTSEITTLLRAVQAAALRHGFLVKVKLRTFLNRSMRSGALAQLSNEQWGKLGRFINPHYPAIGTLTVLGLGTDQIAALRADQVAIDGSSIVVEATPIDVPEIARKYLVRLT